MTPDKITEEHEVTETEAISRWTCTRLQLINALGQAGLLSEPGFEMADAILAWLPEAEMPQEAAGGHQGATNPPSQGYGEGPASTGSLTGALSASVSITELLDITRQVFVEGGDAQDVMNRILADAERVTP